MSISAANTYPLHDGTKGIKILGVRHFPSDEFLATDWTCSGIEFDTDLKEGATVSFVAKATDACQFRAYVDGKPYRNGDSDYFLVSTERVTCSLTDLPCGRHRIRLIKATGYTFVIAELYSLTIDGTLCDTPPADENLYIEFLGDSISCGWGTVGGYTGGPADMDGTCAYPYRLASKLGADYSITALSGKGVICGALNFEDHYFCASPTRSTEILHNFKRRADLVIINLGTNDRGQHVDKEVFRQGYLRMLERVFETNGADCFVYCLWGAMNDAYRVQINEAMSDYLQAHPTAHLYGVTLEKSTAPGGDPSWGHPRYDDNTKYVAALDALLQATYFRR